MTLQNTDMMAPRAVAAKQSSRISRGAFAALGCVFVGLGMVGVFVPVWPTTIFCILALWCFKKSSQRLELWLLNNRLVGPTLRDWDETRSLTLRAKYIAIGAIWLAIFISIVLVSQPWVRVLLFFVAAALTLYLATRRTKSIERVFSL